MTAAAYVRVEEPLFQVRAADPVDFPEMIAHGGDWWKQTEYAAHVPYDPESVMRELYRLHESGMLFVAESDLDIVGFVGGVLWPMYMNDAVLAGSERFLWVRPDYRRSRVATILVGQIEQAAKRRGCKVWTMIAMEAMAPELVGKFYEQLGYHKTESSYSKRLQ